MTPFLLALFVFFVSMLPMMAIVQKKDYFFPALWSHFDYPANQRIFIKPKEIVLLLLWLAVVFFGFFDIFFDIPNSGAWNLLLLITVLAAALYRVNFVQKLKWSPRFLFMNIIAFVILFRFIQYSQNSPLVFLLFLTLAGAFPIALFATYVGNITTKVLMVSALKKARKKLLDYPKVMVIGITGSYGKSGMKELLSTVLSTKLRVVKSPRRLNAEFGLAKFILEVDLSKIDVLILEMGSRKIGEVALMSKYFQPNIVFLTGITPQHVGTFGSLKNIVSAKREIFNSVTPEGIAFLNGADSVVCDIFEDLPMTQKYLYNGEGHFFARNAAYSTSGTTFSFVYPHGSAELSTNLLAPQHIENLVGALACAHMLGLAPHDYKHALQSISVLPHSFQVIQGEHPFVIDDSYNSNVTGVRAGVEHFLRLPLKKKVFIFSGFYEFGPLARSSYEELAPLFSKVDKMFVTMRDFTEPLFERLGDLCEFADRARLQEYAAKSDMKNVGILIMGRVPGWIFEVLKLPVPSHLK